MPAILAVIISNIIWGAAPPIFKYALTDIPPFVLAFIRFFTAGLILLPFIFKHLKNIRKKYLIQIVAGGLWGVSLNVGLLFVGLEYAPSINVHIISSISPLVLYFLSIILLKEKPHIQVIKGMLISLCGVAVIVFAPLIRAGYDIGETYSIGSQLMGNAFFIIAMFGGVMLTIHTKRVVSKVDPLTITGIQFFVGAFTFFPFMVNELRSWDVSQLTSHSWVGIIYGVIFSSAIGYALHNYALKKMHAQELGVFSYIMPLIAVLVAIPLLGEFPDVFFLIGALFVFIGILISERHPHLRKMHRKLHESN